MRRSMNVAGQFLPWAVLALILRQFWVIALVVAVGSLSTLAYGTMQGTSFEAAAVVQIRSQGVLPDAEDRLTGRDNLLAMVQRHQLFPDAESEDQAAVLLRQAIAVRDLTSAAGQVLGLD